MISSDVIIQVSVSFACAPAAPTVLTEVVASDPIMQQDVQGPVLPILTVCSVDEAVAFINQREKPLCVYAYSSNSKVNAATAPCGPLTSDPCRVTSSYAVV